MYLSWEPCVQRSDNNATSASGLLPGFYFLVVDLTSCSLSWTLWNRSFNFPLCPLFCSLLWPLPCLPACAAPRWHTPPSCTTIRKLYITHQTNNLYYGKRCATEVRAKEMIGLSYWRKSLVRAFLRGLQRPFFIKISRADFSLAALMPPRSSRLFPNMRCVCELDTSGGMLRISRHCRTWSPSAPLAAHTS